VFPEAVPGPEIVFHPADALPGSYIARYEADAVGCVAAAGNVIENAGVLGHITLTSGVTEKYPNGVIAVPPIARGRRRIAATAGVPAGWVREKTTARCATTFVAGQLVVPLSPGPIGPSASVDEAEVLVVRLPLAELGFGAGVALGLAEAWTTGVVDDPPLQAVANAARATMISVRRRIPTLQASKCFVS
jgi:putative cofactor-binding repeat protein